VTPTDPQQPAITVRGLRKSFGSTRVLDGIDLDVPAGGICALLGPNGAGKTTTVRILSTLLRPDGGTVRIAGLDPQRQPRQVRRVIGLTGQFAAVDGVLTGTENMAMVGRLAHLRRAEARRRSGELLERFGLTELAGRPAGTYSGGTRRKLDLAMSLIARPRVVFLDEPTTGLDPRSRQTMRDEIRDLAASGITIFLTTQYLEEADQLAREIVVLDHGKVAARGTADELKRLVPGEHLELTFDSGTELGRAATLLATGPADGEPILRVPVSQAVPDLRRLLDRLDDHQIAVAKVALRTPSLDDVFLALTGKDPRAATPPTATATTTTTTTTGTEVHPR
jgi:ABC-2 type transport system ATP-binding protein